MWLPGMMVWEKLNGTFKIHQMFILKGGYVSTTGGRLLMYGCHVEYDYDIPDGLTIQQLMVFLIGKMFPDINFDRGEHSVTNCTFVKIKPIIEENE
jgi:hypothetical protein